MGAWIRAQLGLFGGLAGKRFGCCGGRGFTHRIGGEEAGGGEEVAEEEGSTSPPWPEGHPGGRGDPPPWQGSQPWRI